MLTRDSRRRQNLVNSRYDDDVLVDRIHSLEHRLSLIKSSIVVFVALLVSVGLILLPLVHSQKERWENQIALKQDYPVHIVDAIGESSIKTINQLRTERDLPLIKAVPNDAREVLASWQGCVLNKYSVEAWEDQDCTELVQYGDGFTTHADTYVWESGHSDGGVIPDEGAPKPDAILSKIRESFNESRADEAKATAPHILHQNAEYGKVYVVGSGGEEWQVYIFSIQKTA